MASGGWIGLSLAVRGDVATTASKSVHDEAGASRGLVLHGPASAHPFEATMSIQTLQQTRTALWTFVVSSPTSGRGC
jgi:hypothetical protein